MFNEAKCKSLLADWNTMIGTLRKMEQTVLELVRHPDATPEQMALVSQKYRETFAAIREVHPKMHMLPMKYVQQMAPFHPGTNRRP